VQTTPGLVRIKTAGHGDPAVILLSGAGDGVPSWKDVLPAAAELTQVLAYDRLGTGRSGPASAPRGSFHVAGELEELIATLKLVPPVVLVAHSAGAFHARMFAHRFPERTAALLFVDPSHEDWLNELKQTDPKAWLEHMRWRQRTSHSGGRKRELAAWDIVIGEMREIGPDLPPVPATIISAKAGHSSATDVLFRLHQRWLTHLPRARQVIAENSGHYVQKDAPEVILSALEDLLGEIGR